MREIDVKAAGGILLFLAFSSLGLVIDSIYGQQDKPGEFPASLLVRDVFENLSINANYKMISSLILFMCFFTSGFSLVFRYKNSFFVLLSCYLLLMVQIAYEFGWYSNFDSLVGFGFMTSVLLLWFYRVHCIVRNSTQRAKGDKVKSCGRR